MQQLRRAGHSRGDHARATRPGAIVIAANFGPKGTGSSMTNPADIIEGPFIRQAHAEHRPVWRCACGRAYVITKRWTPRRIATTAALFAGTFMLGVATHALIHAALRLLH
jgi:hypothetical protein